MTVMENRVEVNLDNILFATDFSSTAEEANPYAQALAHRYSATVQLTHVVDLSPACRAPDVGISMDIFRRLGADNLKRTKEKLASSGVHVETTLCEGTEPAREILHVAKEKSVDLIVIGTRRQKGLDRIALGSTAELLIHHADCPVLTLGPAAKPLAGDLNFQRIVYATDFSPEAAKASLFALSLAQDYGAHIYLCHVMPKPDGAHSMDGQELTERFNGALKRLIPDIAREWCEPECVVEHGYAADGILLLAHRVQADLIVLGTRRVSHWFTNIKAGIAFEVIRAATCPVLTVRADSAPSGHSQWQDDVYRD